MDLKALTARYVPRPRIPVVLDDRNVAGLTVSANKLTVTEAGIPVTLEVVLNSNPGVPVRICLKDHPRVFATPRDLVYGPENWEVVQTIKVMTVDDCIAKD